MAETRRSSQRASTTPGVARDTRKAKQSVATKQIAQSLTFHRRLHSRWQGWTKLLKIQRKAQKASTHKPKPAPLGRSEHALLQEMPRRVCALSGSKRVCIGHTYLPPHGHPVPPARAPHSPEVRHAVTICYRVVCFYLTWVDFYYRVVRQAS